MESEGQIKTWLSDRLMALLGYSQGVVVQLVVRLARDCASAGDLAARLVDLGGFPSSPDTAAFAEDVYGRLPHKQGATGGGPGVSEYQRQMHDAAALVKKQSEFKLLDKSDDEEVEGGVATSSSHSGRKRFRKKGLPQENDEEAAALSDSGRSVRRRRCPESDEDAGDPDEEEEMRRDQIERAQLERNIRERDEANTRRLMDRKASKQELDERAHRSEAMDKGETSELRRLSRRAYLQKRKEKKVEEMRDEILDHEFMCDGVRLTDAEEREFRRKKEIYGLVHDHAENGDGAGDYYRMPDAYDDAANADQEKRFSVARRRHDDVSTEARGRKANAFSEQESWEEQQIRKSRLQFGSKDRSRPGEEYEFVFEDGIEFVKSATMLGTEPDDEADELADDIDANVILQRELQDERETLPVYKFKDKLLKAIAEHQVIIVVGETGSGKTTQIPQYLHEAGYTAKGRKIACTQPRRVAAMSVAARVAQEMGVKLGHEVGYSIRFEDCTSEKTVVKYMTDGMLLREFLGEPDLASYGVVIVDEAHERSISTDILLGLVKDVARFRPDMKLLISSATLNAEKFSDFFDMAPVFKIPGRRYKVDIHYTAAPEADYVDAAVATVLQLHVTQPPGDILLFLTGQEEIETVEEILRRRTRGLGTKIAELVICPIYANLPTELQAKIFELTPPGARKVVLSTNIAETSLTIDGISYVVDPGFCKVKSYSPRTGTESLLVRPISKASADQRAGRSGRTGPGKCFRLFTEHSFNMDMEDETVPEIQRSNLASVVLSLKALGINDLVNFDFMDPPASEALLKALENLFALGALNCRGELTKTGRRMVELPLDPMLSKAIVASERYGCSKEVITIASMLSAGNAVFYRPKDKAMLADSARQRFDAANVSDHIALLNVYTEWEASGYSAQWCLDHFVQSRTMRRARDVREQLEALLERVEIDRQSCAGDLDAVRKAITAGFFHNSAQRRRDGTYRTVKSLRTVFVHPSSGMARVDPPARWVVYHELVETTKEYMRQVTELKPEWLLEIAPHYYRDNNVDTPEPKKKADKAQGQSTSGAVATERRSRI
ncbi:pre-mRNA-splicing factor ATP-dependent RNA helicase DEAH1-like [Phragmites australis]|uniref:pre-mRNA-splicing factor ATP-dependent RNA helicase DEAH1-like n=1 Tax=Phragmites australis TaxID=29695 RepID=UPI002D78476F|nr:pre-mRNA-splicing factor ATP-dependent RNA helicase DEAH1-like [Phragmites australis]